jgi:Flp pilus assembly protein TadD
MPSQGNSYMTKLLKHQAPLAKASIMGFMILGTLLANGKGWAGGETTQETDQRRGMEAYSKAKWTEALSSFQRAAMALPENVEAWMFLASCLDKLGQPEQSDKALKLAIKANPNLVIVHFQSGVYYGRLLSDPQGMQERLKALKLEPDFAGAFHAIGLAYARISRHREAVDAYRAAIRIKPDYAQAWSNMAVSYRYEDKWGKALQCAREAVRLDRDNAEAHFNLGVCCLKMGDRSGAFRESSILKKLGSKLSDELYTAISLGYTYPVHSTLRGTGENER